MKFTGSEFGKAVQVIKPDEHAVSTINGTGFDCQTFRELLVHVDVADNGAAGTVDFKLQETGVDSAGLEDTANYADIPLALITQITADDKRAVLSLDLEKRKRFIRGVITIGTNAVDAAVAGVLLHPQYPPATQSADETVVVVA